MAIVAPRPGVKLDIEALRALCRTHLAGYKVPKDFVEVEEVQRSAAGKASYVWAKQVATEALGEATQ